MPKIFLKRLVAPGCLVVYGGKEKYFPFDNLHNLLQTFRIEKLRIFFIRAIDVFFKPIT